MCDRSLLAPKMKEGEKVPSQFEELLVLFSGLRRRKPKDVPPSSGISNTDFSEKGKRTDGSH